MARGVFVVAAHGDTVQGRKAVVVGKVVRRSSGNAALKVQMVLRRWGPRSTGSCSLRRRSWMGVREDRSVAAVWGMIGWRRVAGAGEMRLVRMGSVDRRCLTGVVERWYYRTPRDWDMVGRIAEEVR